MKKAFMILTIGVSLLGFSIISCQKTKPYVNASVVDTSTTVVSSNTASTQTANDISNASEASISRPGSPATQYDPRSNQLQVDSGGNGSSAGKDTSAGKTTHYTASNGDSVTVTAQSGVHPGLVHCDFGAGVKVGGRLRKGLIISHFWKKYYQIGFTDTISFQNYSENGKVITGTIILTRLSDTSFKRVCQLSMTPSGGSTSTYSSTTIRDYSFAYASSTGSFPSSYTMDETGYSTSRDGSSGVLDTATITHPLMYTWSADCTVTGGVFPVKGTINITSSAYKNPRVVDFGTGTCDLTFTVTIGKVVQTITLSASVTVGANG